MLCARGCLWCNGSRILIAHVARGLASHPMHAVGGAMQGTPWTRSGCSSRCTATLGRMCCTPSEGWGRRGTLCGEPLDVGAGKLCSHAILAVTSHGEGANEA